MIKLPKWALPILLIVVLVLTVNSTGLFALPSAEYANPELVNNGNLKSLEWKVKGVKCRGTSQFFISRIKDSGGIASIETYASTKKCLIKYDPSLTDPERIKQLIEAPYFHPESRQWIEGIFTVVD
ncbi:MAG: hypothetical protein GF307_01360 [candidate division Zixibacteria bacterium]|nr:hypothetical protein [candidate division Zixibacteria bacterium]